MRIQFVAILLLSLALIGGVLLYGHTASAATTQNKDAVAVIIGNKDYVGSVPDVDFAHNDAEAMKRFVVEVLGFREDNIIDLRDATLGQLVAVFGTADNAEGQLHDWVKDGKSDVVVFYSAMARRGCASAAESAMKVIALKPEYPYGHWHLASSCAQLGQLDHATAALREVTRLIPNFNRAFVESVQAFQNPADYEHMIEGLKKAGWEG